MVYRCRHLVHCMPKSPLHPHFKSFLVLLFKTDKNKKNILFCPHPSRLLPATFDFSFNPSKHIKQSVGLSLALSLSVSLSLSLHKARLSNHIQDWRCCGASLPHQRQIQLLLLLVFFREVGAQSETSQREKKKMRSIVFFIFVLLFFFDELTQMAAAVGPASRRFTLGKAEMPFDFLRLCLRLAA